MNSNRHDIEDYYRDEELARQELNSYGFSNLTIGVTYDLLFYLLHYNTPIDDKKKLYHRRLSILSPSELKSELKDYDGSMDRASVLFFLASGKKHYHESNDYEEIELYHPYSVFVIWKKLKSSYRGDKIPAHSFLTILPYSPCIRIIGYATYSNFRSLAEEYGVNIPRAKTEDGFEIFVDALLEYDYVLSRPHNLLPPPRLDHLTEDQIEETIMCYTDHELLDAYDIPNWLNRNEIISTIIQYPGSGSQWSLSDDQIRYGTKRNYVSFNIDELDEHWKKNKNGDIRFKNPNWIESMGKMDHHTGGELGRDFPRVSIEGLSSIINNKNLKEKIEEGLRDTDNASLIFNDLKSKLTRSKHRNKIERSLKLLFDYGMSQYGWVKGDKYYPTSWLYNSNPSREVDNDMSDNFKRSLTLEDRKIKLELPIVRYDFLTKDIMVKKQKLHTYINKKKIDHDVIIETSYYLLKRLFDVTIPIFK